jgi:ribosome biogenesis protein Nip4
VIGVRLPVAEAVQTKICAILLVVRNYVARRGAMPALYLKAEFYEAIESSVKGHKQNSSLWKQERDVEPRAPVRPA